MPWLLFLLLLLLPAQLWAAQCSLLWPPSTEGTAGSPVEPVLPPGNYSQFWNRNFKNKDFTSESFATGNHFFTGGELGNYELTTNGTTTRIFINGNLVLNNNVFLNASGSPANLLIYVDGTFEVKSKATIHAFIYARQFVDLRGQAHITGAVTTAGAISDPAGQDNIVYDGDALEQLEPDGFCDQGAGTLLLGLNAGDHALTCQAQQVSLTAGLDSDGDGLADSPYEGPIALAASSGRGDWALISGQGQLDNGTPDDGQAGYQMVAADNGAVTLAFATKEAAELALSAEVDGSLVSDGVTFRPFGLLATPSSPPWGRASQIASHPFSLVLEAVGPDPDALGCRPVAGYSGAKTLRAWFAQSDALAATTEVPSLAGTALAQGEGNAVTLSVSFQDGVSEPLAGFYAESGRLELAFRDDAGLGAPPDGSGSELVGGGSLVFSPWLLRPELARSGTVDNSGGSAPFVAAGADFEVLVRALRWDAGQDGNDDGVPDDSAGLAAVASSLRFNGAGEFLAGAFLPSCSGCAAGSFGPAGFAGGFGGGQAWLGTSYSEVGAVEISTPGIDFLQAGNGIPSLALALGRFYPHHFVASGSPAAACLAGDFSYQDQPFDLELQLQANNQAGTRVGNYHGSGYEALGWPLLDAGHLDFSAENGNDGVDLSGRLALSQGVLAWQNGVMAAETPLQLTFARGAAPDGPFDNLAIGLAISGPNGEDLLAGAKDSNPADGLDYGAGGGSHQRLGGTRLRHGRLLAVDGQGQADAGLALPLAVEDFDGSGFAVNALDNCTALQLPWLTFFDGDNNPLAGNAGLPVGSGSTTATLDPALAADGVLGLSFTAPGDSGLLYYELDYGQIPWLGWDRDGDGAPDARQRGTVIFGPAFRGNDRIIWWRETGN
ncbi:DUF6701 domain-containing protein [Gallaecimonas sp. GXIMD4217]|uniref:DUF6701 domain-containing protein n=1 Tax=Gallaecimonas sp. GXIMD4217 TaxID=3131927 RepID=UPI00311AF37A